MNFFILSNVILDIIINSVAYFLFYMVSPISTLKTLPNFNFSFSEAEVSDLKPIVFN